MRYEDKKDFCQWCNAELWAVNGERPKAFCSDDCRYKYHNAKKKIEREASNALRAINFIQEMLLKDGDLQERALELAQVLSRDSQVLGFECYCGHCGQRRLTIPLSADTCSFCQRNVWRFKVPRQNPPKE